MDEYDEIDWDWDDFSEIDSVPWDRDEEDWGFLDAFANDEAAWISELLGESARADTIICLKCGEIVNHCGCD